uniref:Uncharacterized protein n=1 Tax=Ditylenchus dipsaci TaxID=166011 RepID=A0A915DTJ4_9BILA
MVVKRFSSSLTDTTMANKQRLAFYSAANSHYKSVLKRRQEDTQKDLKGASTKVNTALSYEYPISDKLAQTSDRIVSAVENVPGAVRNFINQPPGYENNNNVNNNDQLQQRRQNMAGVMATIYTRPILSPTSQVSSNREQDQGSGAVHREQGGVNVQVQLRAYANPEHKVAQDRLCTCPQGNLKCVETSPSRSGYNCLVSFMVIVSSADSSVQYKNTPYVPLNSYGAVQAEFLPMIQETMYFQLQNQPTAIDVFVNNLGPVINAQTAAIEHTNTVTHIDTFVQPLNQTLPSQTSSSSSKYNGNTFGGGFGGLTPGGNPGQQQQSTLTGTLLGTTLSISYSVSCKGKLTGPGCDLSCNTSLVNSAKAICMSMKTGYYSLCEWTAGQNSQVTRCQNCPWGIKENAYCMDEAGGVLEANHAGVLHESKEKFSNNNNSRDAPGYNSSTAYHTGYRTHVGEPESTALNVANPNSNSTPTPAPRTGNSHLINHSSNTSTISSNAFNHPPPPLNSKPNKSSMRSPMLYQLPPPAHLGGTSLNDTLNSSFAGSTMPGYGPPSVSADV